jgi:chromosome segregation ATPase
MNCEDHTTSELRLEVELLKKDSQQLSTITNKLSDSIEKIQELNGNLLRMISLHEQQHQLHVRTENELKEDIKELHSRITTTTRELQEKIGDTEKHLADKIDSLRRELQTHETNESTRNNTKAKNIINQIENYKYLILGIAITIGFIAGNINPGLIGILFK